MKTLPNNFNEEKLSKASSSHYTISATGSHFTAPPNFHPAQAKGVMTNNENQNSVKEEYGYENGS